MQIKKTGQFASTTVGKWTATYDLFENDPVDPRVLTMGFHTLGADTAYEPGKDGDVPWDYLLFAYKSDEDKVLTKIKISCH